MNHSRNEIQKIAKIKIIKPKIKNYPIHTDQSKELLYALNEFQIYGEITNVSHGPLITLYEFLPKSGTRSARIISLTDDIGRNIQNSNIRIQTITGNNSIGIEISNQEKDIVLFHDLYKKIDYSNYTLPIILGKDITGDTFCADLSLMPHLLIAGTTGSGKSVGINSMIMSLLLSRSKDECQFVLIDPKRLEFIQYEKIKNLFMPVMYDTDKIINALELLIKEMNSRYDQMAKAKVRNISQYRKKLPYIIVVIDEFADLIAILGKKIEILIQRLAQMARAAGIHLILSTQRPSVDIITGTIKANFPSRIAYKLASKIDSRTIIHDQGAEQLLGNGDLLYLPNTGATIRLHAPYISTDDIKKLLRKI